MGWIETLLAADGPYGFGDHYMLRTAARPISSLMQATNSSLRGSGGPDAVREWILKTAQACESTTANCHTDNVEILGCAVSLSVTFIIILCVFAFLREDKEENITPLCPQLIVKDNDLHFRMPSFDDPAWSDDLVDVFSTTPHEKSTSKAVDVLDGDSEILCRVVVEWPDPDNPGHAGVAALVRIQNQQNITLATVIARNAAAAGQGLALCRAGAGYEIFGFVEPDGDNMYIVRHRTGVELLTFTGDFLNWDVEICNPVNLKVCHFLQNGAISSGHILQHVDAGLVICGLMAAHVHTQLLAKEAQAGGSAATAHLGDESPDPTLDPAEQPQLRTREGDVALHQPGL